MNETIIVEYVPQYGRELVQMWRDSFEQRFYEHHGFEIAARGFERSWQLADIEYLWCAPTGATEHELGGDAMSTVFLKLPSCEASRAKY